MTKSQLQPGMLVETREGNIYLVLPDKLLGISTVGIFLIEYNEDLTHLSPNCDIVKVYTTHASSISDLQDKHLHTLIWVRVTYPIWFKYVGTSLVVKFTSLTEGVCVVAGYGFNFGYSCKYWTPHTGTEIWEQVEEPVTEMTLEEISQALGCKVTLKA